MTHVEDSAVPDSVKGSSTGLWRLVPRQRNVVKLCAASIVSVTRSAWRGSSWRSNGQMWPSTRQPCISAARRLTTSPARRLLSLYSTLALTRWRSATNNVVLSSSNPSRWTHFVPNCFNSIILRTVAFFALDSVLLPILCALQIYVLCTMCFIPHPTCLGNYDAKAVHLISLLIGLG